MSQPQLINGQLCFNCTEVDRARRITDPAKAQEAKALGVDPSRILPGGKIKPNTATDGDIAAQATGGSTASAVAAATATGANQPLSSGAKGRTLNLLT